MQLTPDVSCVHAHPSVPEAWVIMLQLFGIYYIQKHIWSLFDTVNPLIQGRRGGEPLSLLGLI